MTYRLIKKGTRPMTTQQLLLARKRYQRAQTIKRDQALLVLTGAVLGLASTLSLGLALIAMVLS